MSSTKTTTAASSAKLEGKAHHHWDVIAQSAANAVVEASNGNYGARALDLIPDSEIAPAV